MQETNSEQPLPTPQPGILAFRTIWPQLAAGAVLAVTLIWTVRTPNLTTFAFAVGTGLLFAVTVSYLYFERKRQHTATALLSWAGGSMLALFSALIMPGFLPFSVIFVFAAVCYGLGGSSRRVMRTGTILIWLVLAGSFVIYLLEMAGVLVIGVNQPSLLLLAGMCVVCLLLAADVMQRLWRHYNRTEAAFNDLKRANDDLQAARVRLEQHVHAQGELLEVSRVIRSTQEMEPLLDEILIQMKRVVNYDLASVLVLRKGEIVAVRQLGQALANRSAIVAGLMNTPHWKSMIEHQQPVVLADIYQEADSLAPFVQRLGEEDPSVSERQHSWMGLPLIVRGEVVGALSISNSIPAYFDAERVEMSFAFANHAAVAIESSRTREDAVYAAALAERTRLARELHDSVSQSLYGMVLTTRTALEMMDKNPATARDTMRYTLELADAALSEMRALIFELRPESLKEDGLLAALRKQAMALTARHKIQLHLDLCDEEPALPIKTKEALYRLAMEAVQNTIRHAGAANLCLALACGDTLMLTIEDDGCGFNAQADYPGHLGLQTMRERAHAIGGQFDIHSRPGQGTLVSFAIPAPRTGSPTTLSAAV